MIDSSADNSTNSPAAPIQRDCPAWFEHMPFARWGWVELNVYGWPLVAATLFMLLVLCGPWRWLAIFPAALLAQVLYFFRDPPRRVPDTPNIIVAPADGKVVEVTALDHYEFFAGPAVRIGIFLSIFNVHINRSPSAGRVVAMDYQPGKFLNAMDPVSATQNEFMWIGFDSLENPGRRFVVRQVAGLIARRIVCPLVPGQAIPRGVKFGMIKFGSRTELILPAGDVEIAARVGDKLRAGADLVARWK